MRISIKDLLIVLSLIAAIAVSDFASAQTSRTSNIEIGIDRSNLMLQSESVRHQTLIGIHDLHAVWFRDVVSSATPKGVVNIVDEVRLAKQEGLKVLLNVVQLDDDFPNYNAGASRNSCGWTEKPFSRVKPELLHERLTSLLKALKSAQLSVDAFEIGNEDDQYCYNPDIPNSGVASDAVLQQAVSAYAKFLYVVATTIKGPTYFPDAKLITFGIAHAGGSSGHVSTPARFIAMLKNVDGVNYIDNPAYRIDGYGTHLYTSPNNISAFEATLRQDMSVLGSDRPFWVTESGFTTTPEKAFPNKSGLTEWEGIDQFLRSFTSLQSAPLGPVMFFSYDHWLSDANGRLLPGAQIIAKYGSSVRP